MPRCNRGCNKGRWPLGGPGGPTPFWVTHMIDEMAKQRDAVFIAEYCSHYNATKAAIASGWVEQDKSRSARWWGHALLQRPDIREEIDLRLAEARQRKQLTVATVEQMILDLATVDILDIFDDHGILRPLSEIPPHARKAIASVVTTENFLGETTTTVKLWDKKSAIEMLAKYKKMFSDINLNLPNDKKISFTIEGIQK